MTNRKKRFDPSRTDACGTPHSSNDEIGVVVDLRAYYRSNSIVVQLDEPYTQSRLLKTIRRPQPSTQCPMAPVIGRKSQFFPIPHVFGAPVGDDRIRFSLGGDRYVMACSVHGVPYTSKCAIRPYVPSFRYGRP